MNSIDREMSGDLKAGFKCIGKLIFFFAALSVSSSWFIWVGVLVEAGFQTFRCGYDQNFSLLTVWGEQGDGSKGDTGMAGERARGGNSKRVGNI